MPYKDKDKQREYQRKWMKNRRAKVREYRKRKRYEVLNFLGGKCVYCNCNDLDSLEINHKYGGGKAEERRKPSRDRYAFYLAILNGSRKHDDLEITCIVCNAWHKAVKLKHLYNGWFIVYTPKSLNSGIN